MSKCKREKYRGKGKKWIDDVAWLFIIWGGGAGGNSLRFREMLSCKWLLVKWACSKLPPLGKCGGRRQFLVFAGAGVSAATGIYKWKELLQALNGRADVQGISIDDIDPQHYLGSYAETV